jgi:hypothetical protein
MKIKLRFWKCSQAASDGSRISKEVFQEYFNSEDYKEAIENKSMLSSLTHRSRDLKALPPDYMGVNKVIGKNDSLLIVDERIPSPVTYITKMYYDPATDWVCAEADVLDEEGCDKAMSEQIKRFKSLVRAGVKLNCSGVVIGLWANPNGKTGGDVCQSIKRIRGIDWTMDEAMKGARILEYTEEDSFEGEREKNIAFDIRSIKRVKSFSEVNSEIPEMRLFSSGEYTDGLPKTSKVGLQFTTLKAKEFSSLSDYTITEEDQPMGAQKEFSVATLKERLRYNKLSPRQSFRRLILDYRQLIKSQGGKNLPEEDERILKSLFTTDILNILKQIHPEILKGKQIATLLGASSLGKSTRVAAQKLQIPYKMIAKEIEKNGAPTPNRFKKLSEAYIEFINSMVEDVFGDSNNAVSNNIDLSGEMAEAVEGEK